MRKKTLPRLFFFIVAAASPSPSFGGHPLHDLPYGTSIIISQTGKNIQSRPPVAKEKVYIEPRWVESTGGVLVLQPGYWTETETVRDKK
jgi:hypothetical protein